MGYERVWILEHNAYACSAAVSEVREDTTREIPVQSVIWRVFMMELSTY